MTGNEWLYARVHHTTHADGEQLLTSFVPQWARAAREAGVRQWFFIRYADLSGPHLRVRFRGTPDALDDCYTRGLRLWRETSHQPPATGAIARLHPLAEQALPGRGHRRLSFGLYGREHHYYGGPAAMEIAEELFQLSSELSLDAVARTGPDREQRTHIAVELMRACLGAALDPVRRDRFWQLHWQHWSGRPRDAQLIQQAEETAARLHRRPARHTGHLPDDPDPAVAARLLGCQLADGVQRARCADPAVGRVRLLLMQLHMTLNRLGFLPLEEAVLGRIAARPTPPAPGRAPTDSARTVRAVPAPHGSGIPPHKENRHE
ncbi:thiopeptide-type bacteriocin biosynthesis protein [Streptomyces sp. x-80]|uniref:thiopeptide-type bacteriocin biosynthesis protein n=1 Tax=Streptomyces sp. x-80 TaxID=2789282 RepID=UPI0039817B01